MPRNSRQDITRVAKQTPSSGSLRTTVPKDVADALGIKNKDFLHWVVEGAGKGQYAVVRLWRFDDIPAKARSKRR